MTDYTNAKLSIAERIKDGWMPAAKPEFKDFWWRKDLGYQPMTPEQSSYLETSMRTY